MPNVSLTCHLHEEKRDYSANSWPVFTFFLYVLKLIPTIISLHLHFSVFTFEMLIITAIMFSLLFVRYLSYQRN